MNKLLVFCFFAMVSVCVAVDPTTNSYQKSASNGAVLQPETVNVWLKPKAAGGTDFTKTITVKITPKSQTQLDVFLLEDLSGSFYNDLPNLRAMIRSLTSNLRAEYKDAWFGLGSYIDIPVSPFGSSSDYVYRTHIPMTSSTSALQNAVNALRTRSGGDGPESQIFGLQQVARRASSECGFRTASRRVVVLSTDAAYHDAGDARYRGFSTNNGDGVVGSREDYPSVAQVRQALLDANIVPIFAVTSNVVGTYRTLVSQLGFGAVTTLSSTSSNLINAIKAGLDSVRTSVVANVISDPAGFVTQSPSPATQHAASYETQRTFTVKLGYQNKGTKSDNTVKVSVQGFGIVTFNVDVNQKPSVTATSTVQTNEGQDVRVTLGGSDPDGNTLSYRMSRMPTKGQVFQNNGGAVGAQITSTSTYMTTNSFWYRPTVGQSGSPYTYLYVRSYDSTTSDVQLSSNERSIRVNVLPKPDPPVGTTGTQTVAEDSTANVITLTGTDPEGFTAFTAQIKVLPARGTLTQFDGTVISSVGTTVTDSQRRVRYTPPANANGNNYASFGYILRDNQNLWSTVKTVPINVTPVNDPPIAVIAANPLTVKEQVDFFIALDAFDIDDTSHTFTIVSAPTQGQMFQCTGPTTKSATQITGSNTAVTFKQGNTAYVAYNSNSNTFGNNYATFSFRVNDGDDNSAVKTVTINVQNTVDAPTASYTPVPAATNEDTPLQTLVLTGTSIDAPLRSINQIQVLSLPANGKLYQRTGNARGAEIVSVPATFSGTSKQLWYEPALNDNGNGNTFKFRVSDGVPSATATVTLEIAAVNDAPVAIAQTYSADERVNTVFTLKATDVDSPGAGNPGGKAIIVTPLTGSKGKMYQWATGNTPGAAITNADTEVTDSQARIIYNSDVAASPTSYGIGFESFSFRWEDDGTPKLQSAPATCSIDVANNVDKPTANTATVSTDEDTDAVITLGGSTNDGKAYFNTVITRLPTKGKLYQVVGASTRGAEITALSTVVTNTVPASFQAKVIYVPELNGNGNSFDNFQFKVSDNQAGSPSYSLPATITVNVNAVNDRPTASAETPVELLEDSSVVIDLSGADVDGDTLTAHIFNINTNGGVMKNNNNVGTTLTNNSVVASKKVYFAPPANAHSTTPSTPFASFEFFMRDNSGVSATQDSTPVKVDIIVVSVPDAPTPNFLPNPATINEEGNIVITLTGTSIDGASSMSATVTQLPTNGQLFQVSASGEKVGSALTTTPVAITQNNGGGLGKKLLYEGNLNFFGNDMFTYQVNDGTPSALATATVTVNAVNDKPTASAPSPVTLLEDDSVTIELQGTDVEDSSLTYKVTAVPAKGTLHNGPTTGGTLLTNGATVTDGSHRVTYQPPANENSNPAGSVFTSFSFTVEDSASLASDPFQVNLIVEPVNDAPTSHPITININEDSSVLINLPGLDIDAGETLTAVIDQMPTDGMLYQVNNDNTRGAPVNMSDTAVVVTNNNRTLWFEPEANMHGTPYTTFTFFVQDSDGVKTASQTCTINVASVQDPPFAFAETPLTGDEDSEIIIRLQGRDDDFAPGTQPDLNLTLTVLPACVSFTPPNPKCSLSQSDGTPITSVPTLVTSSQGFLTFRPGRDQNGDNYASLQFTATDGIEVSAAATVDINVVPINDLPTYTPVAFLVTPEDTPKVMIVQASDRDGPNNPPTLVVIKAPQHGDIHEYDANAPNNVGAKIVGTGTPARYALSGQRAVYVPHANYYGRDSFQWTVNDGLADAVQPWRTIVVVSGVNDAPIVTALKSEFTTTQGELIALDNVTATDVDAGANPVLLTISNTVSAANLTMGSHSLSVVSTDGTTTVYEGSISQVADGLSRLFYALDNKETKNVEDTVTITVNDNGYSQSKRVPQGPALEGSTTIKVTTEPKKEPFAPQADNTDLIVAGAAAGVAGAAAAFKGLRHFGAAKDAEILDHDATPDAAFSNNPIHEGQGGWQGNIMYGQE